ncbi:MAG: DUF5103 domain-containing protein [Bacteroidetes Order II. Incertae sedis bacterium]|nr:DUF5103 domain-containing protein [Bacteroidetes Order II. bacterium]
MKQLFYLFLLIHLGGCAHMMGLQEEKTPISDTSIAPLPPIASIQLYAGTNQTQAPVIRLNSDEFLQLHFDVLSTDARPLSVYFFHEDVTGKRDLQPIEYMQLAREDVVLETRPSSHTQIPYTHYRYVFPNEKIQFRVSGRYTIRVTAQGRPEDIRFERTFFVYENVARLSNTAQFIQGNRRGGFDFWPELVVELPDHLTANVYDLTVCGYEHALNHPIICYKEPRLNFFPRITYGPNRHEAFAVKWDRRVLDLRRLQNGGKIEQVNRSLSPFKIKLMTEHYDQDLYSDGGRTYGNPLYEAHDVPTGYEALQAEYVDVVFRFIPVSKTALPFPVFLQGDFNEWKKDTPYKMTWSTEEQAYTLDVRLKQGLFEYRYHIDDPAFDQSQTSPWFNRTLRWQTLVFYKDTFLGSDRLLGMEQRIWE